MRKLLTTENKSNFLYLLFLTSFFLLLEISFFWQSNSTYFADFPSISNQMKLPVSIIPGIVWFVLAQFLVHFIFCIFIWLLASAISSNLKITLAIWSLGIFTTLCANQYYYPNSKFAELTAIFFSDEYVKIFFLMGVVTVGCLLFFALLRSRVLQYVGLVLSVLFAYYYFTSDAGVTGPTGTLEKPNIIIIGVDSLRPDYLGFFGRDINTPFIDTFLNQAVVFSDAMTPLARTFPSWSSILMGEYPKKTGIRSNLAQQNTINFSSSLPNQLKKLGYEAIYATDETRFSNISQRFGFDDVISPPVGFNDFLLGTFNDFPFANLLANTSIGKWLFPHTYANRAVAFAYDPNAFSTLVKLRLQGLPKKPLFLAVHFCLPHHPYLWKDLSGRKYDPLTRYQKSIERADQQLADFLAVLQRMKMLDHAIVVLLSDHGEALELEGDRITENHLFLSSKRSPILPKFQPSGIEHEKINQSVGHGTDVLSLTQYHTLLAFRSYGEKEIKPKVIPGTVSLLSIKPTLLQFLGLKNQTKSLVAFIESNVLLPIPDEHIFIESDFTPQAIRTVYPETKLVLLEGIKIFQVDPKTTRLSIKNDMLNMIIKSKQVADLYGEWLLAYYPIDNRQRMPILINLRSGQWTNDLRSIFAKKSPAVSMKQKLRAFYRDDIK